MRCPSWRLNSGHGLRHCGRIQRVAPSRAGRRSDQHDIRRRDRCHSAELPGPGRSVPTPAVRPSSDLQLTSWRGAGRLRSRRFLPPRRGPPDHAARHDRRGTAAARSGRDRGVHCQLRGPVRSRAGRRGHPHGRRGDRHADVTGGERRLRLRCLVTGSRQCRCQRHSDRNRRVRRSGRPSTVPPRHSAGPAVQTTELVGAKTAGKAVLPPAGRRGRARRQRHRNILDRDRRLSEGRQLGRRRPAQGIDRRQCHR